MHTVKLTKEYRFDTFPALQKGDIAHDQIVDIVTIRSSIPRNESIISANKRNNYE